MSRRNSQWFDPQKAEAAYIERAKEKAEAYPHKSLKDAMDFTENLRDCAMKGIKGTRQMEDREFALYERAFWQGVDQACTAIRRATTISR